MSRIDKDWRVRVPIYYHVLIFLIVLMYKVSTDKAKIIFIARIKFILVKFNVFISNKNRSGSTFTHLVISELTQLYHFRLLLCV